jgi:hypothetical protein
MSHHGYHRQRIHQPNLLKNLKEYFKDLIEESARVFETPTAPKSLIIRPKDGEPLNSPEKQRQFRLGVGMLLYLVNHSRPDISNSVRELSKVADGATEGHFKSLLRTIKYVLSTEDHGLLLQPQLKMKANIEKEYLKVSTPEIRIKVSVFMVMSYTSVVHL